MVAPRPINISVDTTTKISVCNSIATMFKKTTKRNAKKFSYNWIEMNKFVGISKLSVRYKTKIHLLLV